MNARFKGDTNDPCPKYAAGLIRDYHDPVSGLSLDYPTIPEWVIQEVNEPNQPTRLLFTKPSSGTTLIFGVLKVKDTDLTNSDTYQAALDEILTAVQGTDPTFELKSSGLVINPNNGARGIQLLYQTKIKNELFRARHIAFFEGTTRYDVTALGPIRGFDYSDKFIFTTIINSMKFPSQSKLETIEIEANTLEEAHAQLKAQLAQGFLLPKIEVISQGQGETLSGSAKTLNESWEKVRSQIPPGAEVIQERVVYEPQVSKVSVSALDETSAKNSHRLARNEEFVAIRLVKEGSKGMLGIGKKPNSYEIETRRLALVEITYITEKAKVRAVLG
ncbi:MAG: hypothetical protein K8L91_31420 [Anaerolineae bacterium]|nr:hypothetical protein [Anaerolineae bacterium]